MYVYVCVCVSVCIHMYMYIYVYLCICIYMHIYTYTYAYIYIYTHMYEYIYTYIYTYTNILYPQRKASCIYYICNAKPTINVSRTSHIPNPPRPGMYSIHLSLHNHIIFLRHVCLASPHIVYIMQS